VNNVLRCFDDVQKDCKQHLYWRIFESKIQKMPKLLFVFLIFISAATAQNKFHLNADASIDSVFYPIEDRSASEVREMVSKWTEKQQSKQIVTSPIENKKEITIDGILNAAVERFTDGKTQKLNAEYRLSVAIRDHKYGLLYHHKAFKTADGNSVALTLENLVSRLPDSNGNYYDGMKKEYEENVQRLMNSLYLYIVSN